MLDPNTVTATNYHTLDIYIYYLLFSPSFPVLSPCLKSRVPVLIPGLSGLESCTPTFSSRLDQSRLHCLPVPWLIFLSRLFVLCSNSLYPCFCPWLISIQITYLFSFLLGVLSCTDPVFHRNEILENGKKSEIH